MFWFIVVAVGNQRIRTMRQREYPFVKKVGMKWDGKRETVYFKGRVWMSHLGFFLLKIIYSTVHSWAK